VLIGSTAAFNAHPHCLHILCGTVFRDYGALVTGGDMEPSHGRRISVESLTKDLVGLIEEAVNLR
jgi:misacylated tRNA(Ala) deacylase